jgi:hypothetical protein
MEVIAANIVASDDSARAGEKSKPNPDRFIPYRGGRPDTGFRRGD